jgi:hypothetical protein
MSEFDFEWRCWWWSSGHQSWLLSSRTAGVEFSSFSAQFCCCRPCNPCLVLSHVDILVTQYILDSYNNVQCSSFTHGSWPSRHNVLNQRRNPQCILPLTRLFFLLKLRSQLSLQTQWLRLKILFYNSYFADPIEELPEYLVARRYQVNALPTVIHSAVSSKTKRSC